MHIPSTVLASRLIVRTRLRHLQVLVKVAELGSVQRAAAAVGLTQPSATHVLGDLEKLLDCSLFQRHARGMTPTRAGQALVPLARRILDTVNDCADVIAALAGPASGVVRVAAIAGAITGFMAPLLPAFSEEHADVLVQVQELDIEQIGTLLARGDVDLVLCHQPPVVPGGWTFETLLDDRFVVVCGPDHPLAGKRRLRLDQLWQETWLQGPLASAPRRAFDELVAQHDTAPKLRLVSSRSPFILWSMLQRQRLVSLIPFSLARQLLEARQLVALDVKVPVAFEPIGVMTRDSDLGEATRTLRDFLLAARQPGERALPARGRATQGGQGKAGGAPATRRARR